MNNPIVFVILMSVLYAVANVIIQRKLPGNPGIVTAAIAQIVMVAMSWATLTVSRKTGQIQDVQTWKWCLAVGVLYFFADFFYFHAYALGIRATTATPLILTMPVFVAFINFFVFDERPKPLHYLAFVFAILMITCVVLAGDDDGSKDLPAP